MNLTTTHESRRVSALDMRQAEALARLFAFYDAIDDAIALSDADQVAWLVDARAEVIEELVQTRSVLPLSPDVEREIAEHERALHLGIVRLHDAIFQSLSAQRRVAHAVSRYAMTH